MKQRLEQIKIYQVVTEVYITMKPLRIDKLIWDNKNLLIKITYRLLIYFEIVI